MRAGRTVIAVLVSIVAIPVGIWAGLVAAATIIGQVLAGVGIVLNADWMQVFNPAVWFGFQNVAGTGSLIDSLLGGPGAPGGSAWRSMVFMIMGILAASCFTGVRGVWRWASRPAARTPAAAALDEQSADPAS